MFRSDRRIEGISVYRLGPFDELNLNFPKNTRKEYAEIHVFTGGNGAGKSTLLYALQHLLSGGLGATGDRDQLRIFRSRWHSADSFGTRFEWTLRGWRNSDDENRDDARKWGYWSEEYTHEVSRTPLDLVPFAYSGFRQLSDQEIKSGGELNSPPLAGHLSFKKEIDSSSLLQWLANTETQEALAFKENDLRSAERYKQKSRKISKAISDICGEPVGFKLNHSPSIELKVLFRNGEFPLDALPDGLKSVMSWVADLAMRIDRITWTDDSLDAFEKPIILLLDEIDIHLHPKWQRKVLPVVQKLFPNAQIFVSTHSPFVVGSVEDAWVYKLDDAKNQKTIEAIPSGAGTSYEVLFEEIFGIDEHFDVQSQAQIKTLEAERDALLKDKTHSTNEFNRLAAVLASRSEELNGLVALQIRQLKKHDVEVHLE